MRLKLKILLLICSIHWMAIGQLNDRVEQIHTAVYDMRLEEAERALLKLQSTEPQNTFVPYLYNASDFFKVFVSEDEHLFNQKIEEMEGRVDQMEKQKDASPWKWYNLAESKLQLAALYAKFDHNFKSAKKALGAYHDLERGMKTHPDFTPQYVHMGLLQMAVGSLPGNYQFIAGLFGLKGDISGGYQYVKKGLKGCETTYPFLMVKSVFVYQYVAGQLKLKMDYDAHLDPSSNILLTYVAVKSKKAENKHQEVLHLLKNRPQGEGYFPFYYLDYQEGVARFSNLEGRSVYFFNKYLKEYPGQNYIKSSHQYLSWYYFLYGEIELSEEHRKLVRTIGNDFYGSDRMALLEAERKYNKTLLMARNQYDAGAYQIALAILDGAPPHCDVMVDCLEYYYRLGRIYQRTKQLDAARAAFSTSLAKDQGKNKNYYTIASALQLGHLYRSKDAKKARSYYNMVLAADDVPYYEGMQQQAKTGLVQLK